MYTIIFARERTDDKYNSEIHVECVQSEKEVHDFVRFKTFEQERLSGEAYRFRGERYEYGDYGFLVIKNGEVVFECNHFSSIFDECDTPLQTEGDMLDCFQDQSKGVNQADNLFSHINTLEAEEKTYNKSLHSYREEVKKQAEIAKEKDLLRKLLEKYPDMKQ